MAEDGEEYQAPGEQLERGLLSLAGQLGAGFAEAMREPRYEYRLVAWDEVNPMAAEGWELRAAHVELTRFVMARKLGPADEAAALLAQAGQAAQFGLPVGRYVIGADGVPYGPFPPGTMMPDGSTAPEDGSAGHPG